MFSFTWTSDPGIGEPPSFSSFPAHSEVNHFGSSVNGAFGPAHIIPMPLLPDGGRGLPMTSDLPQTDFQTQGSFVNPNRLRAPEPPAMPPPAAAAPPEPAPMEASPMPGVQTQGDAEGPPCKYDLLSSIPCE